MKPNKSDVANRIRFIRESLNLSLSLFGKEIDNTPKGTVGSWERGVCIPSIEKLQLMATLSNTTIEWILWGDIREFVENVLVENQKAEYIKNNIDILNKVYCLLIKNGFSEHEKYPTTLEVISIFNKINDKNSSSNSKFFDKKVLIKKVNNTIIVYRNNEKNLDSEIIFDYTFLNGEYSNDESELLLKKMIQMFSDLEFEQSILNQD